MEKKPRYKVNLEWDYTFMEIAETIAKRSKSTRLQVGAVLVRDNRIISTGYNGLPSGYQPDILEDKNGNTKSIVIHAELNCILNCAKEGISVKGCTLFITHSPCMSCAALIMQSGITKIIYKEQYRDISSLDFFTQNGIIVRQLQFNNEKPLQQT